MFIARNTRMAMQRSGSKKRKKITRKWNRTQIGDEKQNVCKIRARVAVCSLVAFEWVSECICDTPTGIWLVVTKDRAYILRLPFIIKNHRGARQHIQSISRLPSHSPSHCARPSTKIACRAHIHCKRACKPDREGGNQHTAPTHRVRCEWKNISIYSFMSESKV